MSAVRYRDGRSGPEHAAAARRALAVAVLAACWPWPAAAEQYRQGVYLSSQVNVAADGRNIVGDAANEPSLALNPLDPANIVVSWRQFDSVASSFRQGGWAYTADAGEHWHFAGTITPGEGRSNPTLDVDALGHFYYQSLHFDPSYTFVQDIQVIKSLDGGRSWEAPVFAYGQGGDKAQMAVDRSGTASDGHVYLVWRDCLAEKCFVRSTDRGASFQPPLAIPSTPTFGTMRVGNDGELYLAGRLEPPEFDPEQPDRNLHRHLFSRSLNARDPAQIPTFDSREVDLGGLAPLFLFKQNPNQYGPVGDVQVGVDVSTGAMRGQLYLLATVDPPGEDNLDISFVRSLDGGDSWSTPVRINDDARSQHHWNWFGMMGVAPNSRIDAVWYDTRDSASYKVSRLYYSYSWDGGQTWSKNVPVSPAFDTTLAYPHASTKIGDYSTLVSDANAAHIAYTATFNGEQDVYYLQVFPDCNQNGQSDVADIAQRRVGDTNANHLPDVCEAIRVLGDIDADRDVDQADIDRVLAGRGRRAAPGDPRDIDGNGTINVLDARKLAAACTRPRCAM
ncbi:hypothetical protein [Methylomonas koyamae]|uniref:Exo-alpha-sialidase n=1 Tax=Methylomonas koyamae TaxID=702114 RepID=A0AA91I6V4_9GAMM|nr:hypothetical protein [Methylomonas koyamae]OAI27527.1 hypothetical protein A1356_09310 [Methylomonas koyamae]